MFFVIPEMPSKTFVMLYKKNFLITLSVLNFRSLWPLGYGVTAWSNCAVTITGGPFWVASRYTYKSTVAITSGEIKNSFKVTRILELETVP